MSVNYGQQLKHKKVKYRPQKRLSQVELKDVSRNEDIREELGVFGRATDWSIGKRR